MSAPTSPPARESLLSPRYRGTTTGVIALVFLAAFEALAVATVMPTVSRELDGRSLFAAAFSSALAASLVGMVVAGLWADRRGPVELKTAALPVWLDRTLGLAAGILAGFTSQISHAGGPPFQIYALPKRLPRDVFIGASSIFFAVVNWMKVPAYLALGQFTRESLLTSAVLLPVAIASTWAGVWLVRRVSGEKFYTVIYALLVAVGAKLVWDGVAGLI